MLYKQCGLKECKTNLNPQKELRPRPISSHTSAGAVLSAPPKLSSLAMLSVEDIAPSGRYAD